MLATRSYSPHLAPSLSLHDLSFSNFYASLDRRVSIANDIAKRNRDKLHKNMATSKPVVAHCDSNTTFFPNASGAAKPDCTVWSDAPAPSQPLYEDLSLDEIAQNAIKEWNHISNQASNDSDTRITSSVPFESLPCAVLSKCEAGASVETSVITKNADTSTKVPETIVISEDEDDVLIIEERPSKKMCVTSVHASVPFPPALDEEMFILPCVIPDSVCLLQGNSARSTLPASSSQQSPITQKCTHPPLCSDNIVFNPVSSYLCHSPEKDSPCNITQNMAPDDSSDEIEIIGCFKETRNNLQNRCSKVTFMRALGLQSSRMRTTSLDSDEINSKILDTLSCRQANRYMKNDKIPLRRVRSLYEYVTRHPESLRRKGTNRIIARLSNM